MRVAECESTFDKYAENPNSTATGLFQYLIGTWNEAVDQRELDWKPEDRMNAEKSTDMIIYHVRKGQLSKWNASKHCWNK